MLNEHVIGKIKRFKILSCRYRNRRKRFGLRVNLISAIYNFELRWFGKRSIKIKTIDLNSEQKDLAFAVKKGDKEILDKINNGLEKLKQNGTYEKLMQKWFSTTS